MYNTPPIFIEVHSSGVKGLIDIRNINTITPYTDTETYICVNYRDEPLYVDESYEEIKRKLVNAVWIV